MPESSAIAGNPERRAALRALISAFSRKVLPVSGGASMPKSDWRARLQPRPDSNSENSRSLPGLPLASTTRMSTTSAASGSRAYLGLQLEQLRDALGREVEQRIELVAAERMAFGRALHLDEATTVVHDDVHVGLGAGVLGVVEIDDGHAVADANRDRRD